MTEVFLKLVNMSISAGWLVLAVLLLRLLLRKAPRWVHVLLWGIVAVRLLCPFSIESALSLIPSARTIPGEIISGPDFNIQSGIPLVDRPVNDYLDDRYFEGVTVPTDHGANVMGVLTVIWLVGMALLIAYTAISYLRLRRQLGMAVRLRENIFQCEVVSSPFVLGILKPRIYLPFTLDDRAVDHVVAHEWAHIRRLDHWWKPLGFLLLTVYWFNPLMWVAYILLCRDIELACDEKVIAQLGSEERADYTQALVACAVGRRTIAACPLAFGEVGVKDRVKSIMNYRKPGFWVIVLALILCAVLAVSMLTDPIPEHTPAEIFSTLEPGDVQWAQATIWDTPAGDHIMLEEAQIAELVAILKSLDARDFEEKQGAHGASFMLSCGEREIMLQTSFEEVYFVFDSETAELLGNVSWSVRNTMLNDFLDNIVDPQSEIIDWVSDPQDIDSAEATHPAFPDVTFRWTEGAITANGETLIQGMPIWNAYFADLNGDGKPEICATVSYGSGMVDTHVVVCDYANCQEFTLWDRGVCDYYLRLENGVLLCEQYAYPGTLLSSEDPLAIGKLVLIEGSILALDLLDENTGASVWIRTIEDRSVTEGITTDEALEPFWEDEHYIYSFPSVRSHLVLVTYSDGNSEDIKTALKNGRADISDLDRFGIPYYAEPKADPLEEAISRAILEHFAGDDPDGLIHVESHVVLDNEMISGTPLQSTGHHSGHHDEKNHVTSSGSHIRKTIVYLLVHHAKYSTYGGELEAVGCSYVPTAITFRITDSDEYVLEEYWEPGDGGDYADDIRDKFPAAAAEESLNDQAYIEALKAENLRKAQAYLGGTVGLDERIGELLNEIQSSPLHSSNPGDYIHAHEAEFEELVGCGEYTLRYCFTEFLKGNQTDLRGHIMAQACKEIMLGWGEAYTMDSYLMTGQDWFDEFETNAHSLSHQMHHEELRKHYPGAHLLLEMTDEAYRTKE